MHGRGILIRRLPAGDYFGDSECRPVFQEWVNDLWYEKARASGLIWKSARVKPAAPPPTPGPTERVLRPAAFKGLSLLSASGTGETLTFFSRL